MTRIGVQAMMLKREFETDGAFATLQRLSDLGFHAVEISQIPMSEANVGEIDRARDELGMEVAALSAVLDTPVGAPGESLTNDFDKIVADCTAAGLSDGADGHDAASRPWPPSGPSSTSAVGATRWPPG